MFVLIWKSASWIIDLESPCCKKFWMWNINVSREVTFQIDTVCMSIVSNFSQGVCTLQMHRESRDRYNEIRHAYLSYSKWRKSKNLQLNCFHKEHDFHLRFLIDWVKLEFVVIMVIAETSSVARPFFNIISCFVFWKTII